MAVAPVYGNCSIQLRHLAVGYGVGSVLATGVAWLEHRCHIPLLCKESRVDSHYAVDYGYDFNHMGCGYGGIAAIHCPLPIGVVTEHNIFLIVVAGINHNSIKTNDSVVATLDGVVYGVGAVDSVRRQALIVQPVIFFCTRSDEYYHNHSDQNVHKVFHLK